MAIEREEMLGYAKNLVELVEAAGDDEKAREASAEMISSFVVNEFNSEANKDDMDAEVFGLMRRVAKPDIMGFLGLVLTKTMDKIEAGE